MSDTITQAKEALDKISNYIYDLERIRDGEEEARQMSEEEFEGFWGTNPFEPVYRALKVVEKEEKIASKPKRIGGGYE